MERACSSSPTQRPTKRELIESDGKQLRHIAVVFQAAADTLLRFHGLHVYSGRLARWYFRCGWGRVGRGGPGRGGVEGGPGLRADLVREEGWRRFFRKHAVWQRVLEPTLHLSPPEVKQLSKARRCGALRPNGDRTAMCLPNGMPNGLFSLPDDVGVLVFQLLLDKDSLALLRRTREKAHEMLLCGKAGAAAGTGAHWPHSGGTRCRYLKQACAGAPARFDGPVRCNPLPQRCRAEQHGAAIAPCQADWPVQSECRPRRGSAASAHTQAAVGPARRARGR